jgi:hypothetical protein
VSTNRVDVASVTDVETFAGHVRSAMRGDAVVFRVEDGADGAGRVRSADVAVLIPFEAWAAIGRLMRGAMDVPLTCWDPPAADVAVVVRLDSAEPTLGEAMGLILRSVVKEV